MEFVITCPVDGPVEVSLEDVDTVVLREPEQADIMFTCPECGTEVQVTVRIPSFLMAAIEAMAEDDGGRVGPLARMMALAVEIEGAEDVESDAPDARTVTADVRDDDSFDAYCEYFRRQLDEVETVDDVMRYIGCEED